MNFYNIWNPEQQYGADNEFEPPKLDYVRDDLDEDQLREEDESDFVPPCAAWLSEDEIAYAEQLREEAERGDY